MRTRVGALLIAVVLACAARAQFLVEGGPKGRYYHRLNCPLLRNMDIKTLLYVHTARAAGMYHREPCPKCKPPIVGPRKRVIRLRPTIYLIVDRRKGLYHDPDCPLIKQIPKRDRAVAGSVKELALVRARPCPKCKPKTLEKLRAQEAEAKAREAKEPSPEATVKAKLLGQERVSVPGNEPFVETNIRVKKGQITVLRATGRVQVEGRIVPGKPIPLWGPEGTTVDGKPTFCLMARVGKQVERIGRSRGVRWESSGTLYLGFLDSPDGYRDNKGGFEVKVVVFQPLGAPKPAGEGSPEKPGKSATPEKRR